MAWTAPRTWVANEVVTASIMNAHVRDNLLQTSPALVTTAGDIVYATGANTLARLAAVAYRMARSNAAGSAQEFIASLNLAQAPVFASANSINTGNALTDIVSQAFTTHGGITLLLATLTVRESKSAINAPYQHNFALVEDGVSLDSHTLAAGGPASGSLITYTSHTFVWMKTPSAAAHTYKLQTSYVTASTSGTPVSDGRLLLIELAP